MLTIRRKYVYCLTMFILESTEEHEPNQFIFASESLGEVSEVANEIVREGHHEKVNAYLDLIDSLEVYQVEGFGKNIVTVYDLRERREFNIEELKKRVQGLL